MSASVNGKAGETRSVLRREYLLHTPDAFVRTPLPEIAKGVAIVHVSPQLGARFVQYTAELEADGTLAAIDQQRFVWVLAGHASIAISGEEWTLRPGSYAYLPELCDCQVKATSAATLAVIEKPYEVLHNVVRPNAFFAHEDDVVTVALGGDPQLLVKSLLPADVAFDFAVNTMTYAPGTALAQVEVHVMEHGLVMLEGAGTYRLGDDLHTVAAGDFIWMAPYCPQWFVAEGTVPAKYLIYKDWNRRPKL
jgi:(S)-ureidoglycine aminohydrolase